MGTLRDEGSLAFYDPETERVTVRGASHAEASSHPRARADDAVQDQHFDLGRLDDVESSDAQDGFRALVEGDATRIENRYVETLSAADRRAFDEDPDSQGAPGSMAFLPFSSRSSARPTCSAPISSICSRSPTATRRSTRRSTLRQTPTPRRSIPSASLRTSRTDAPLPPLEQGETRFDDGDMGALSIYLFLSTRLDVHEALHAIDGWDGDAYVGFERDGGVCFRVAIAVVDVAAAERLEAGLTSWAKMRQPPIPRSPGRGRS